MRVLHGKIIMYIKNFALYNILSCTYKIQKLTFKKNTDTVQDANCQNSVSLYNNTHRDMTYVKEKVIINNI